ncbi:High-affinity branched-chain amino acid transport system permease protein LivH [compost metagenome]
MKKYAGAAILLLIALFFPLIWSDPYYQRIGVMALIYAIVSTGLGTLVGQLRMISAGHSAFFGIGAYTSGIMTVKAGSGFLVGFVAAIVITALIGLAVSLPLVRMKGHFFAMATLAFGIITQMVLLNWETLTNGPNGIPGISLPRLFGFELANDRSMYYFTLVMLLLTLGLLHRLYQSPIGRAFRAIREDPVAAATLGIPVFRYRVLAFTLSAGIAGMAGSIFAHYMSFISYQSFNPTESFILLSMVIIGGMNHFAGPLLGAILLTVLPEWLRELQDYRFLLYGLILTGVLLFRPSGLLGGPNALGRREIYGRTSVKSQRLE